MSCANCKCEPEPSSDARIELLEKQVERLKNDTDNVHGRINNLNMFIDALMQKYIGHKPHELLTDDKDRRLNYFLTDQWIRAQHDRHVKNDNLKHAIQDLQAQGYDVIERARVVPTPSNE